MAVFLEYTQKNGKVKTKEYNSYYLAITDKNNLMRKGISAKIVETPTELRDDQCHDSDKYVKTVYSKADLDRLAKIRKRYMPELFPAPKKTLTKTS